jgi:hypothetical protein
MKLEINAYTFMWSIGFKGSNLDLEKCSEA